MATIAYAGKTPAVADDKPVTAVESVGTVTSDGHELVMHPYAADVFSLADRCELGSVPAEQIRNEAFAQARVMAQLQLANEAHGRSVQRHDKIDDMAARISLPGGAPLGAVELVHAAAHWAENNKAEAFVVGVMAASKAARARRIANIRSGYLEPIANPKYWNQLVIGSALKYAEELGIRIKALTLKGSLLRIGSFVTPAGQDATAVSTLWAKTMQQLGIREVSFGDPATLSEKLKQIHQAINKAL